MLQLSSAQRRSLRERAHALNPVASVADKGLSSAVLAEIERALTAHELVKVRVYGEEREARERILETICESLDCAPVQHIGHILVIYRPRPEQAPVAIRKPPRPRKTVAAPAARPRAPARRRRST